MSEPFNIPTATEQFAKLADRAKLTPEALAAVSQRLFEDAQVQLVWALYQVNSTEVQPGLRQDVGMQTERKLVRRAVATDGTQPIEIHAAGEIATVLAFPEVGAFLEVGLMEDPQGLLFPPVFHPSVVVLVLRGDYPPDTSARLSVHSGNREFELRIQSLRDEVDARVVITDVQQKPPASTRAPPAAPSAPPVPPSDVKPPVKPGS